MASELLLTHLLCAPMRIDDALLQQAQLYKLEKPDNVDLKSLREFTNRREGGVGSFFCGREARPWEVDNTEDLVTLYSRHEESDSVTKWFRGGFILWLDKVCLRRFKV
jgi:hypothetical protein